MTDSVLPTSMRVVLIAQSVFAFVLLSFSSRQFSMLRYQLFYEPALFHPRVLPGALFCIFVPPALLLCSVAALRGHRWAIRASVIGQVLLCIASAIVGIPILVSALRGVDIGWFLPLFLLIAAAIFFVSLAFAVILYRHLRNSNATGIPSSETN